MFATLPEPETIKVWGLDQFCKACLTEEQTEALAEEVNNTHSYGDTSFVGISPSELIQDLQRVGIPVPEGLKDWGKTGVLFEITNQSCLLQ